MTTRHDEMTSDEELEQAFGPEEPLGISERQLMTSLIHRMTGEGADALTIGPYKLGRRLGEGAMGVIYETYDAQLDRKIAIKVLRKQHSKAHSHPRKSSLREAETMARVVHDNIVKVYEVDYDSGQAWISMELVKGSTLREWLHDFDGPWKEVLHIYVQVGRGIVAAHERGIVHGDLKPDNILVGDDNVPKVTDFGLAVASVESEALGGTPEYMAPEQYLDGGRSIYSDQYSFCVALFEGLTERHPYSRRSYEEFASTARAKDPETTAQVIRQRYRREIFVNANHGRLYWPRSPYALPGRIRRAIARGLDPRPDRRFGSMAELLTRLDLAGLRRTQKWISAVAAGLLILPLGGALVAQKVGRQKNLWATFGTGSAPSVW